jgi:hypothetical protein
MSTSPVANNFKRLRAYVRAKATEPVASRMSAWLYARVIVGVGILVGLLLLSFFFSFRPAMSWREALGFFRDTFLGVTLVLGVHLVLRYSENPARHWLDRHSLGFNVALRMSVSVALLLANSLGRYYFEHIIHKTDNSVPPPLRAVVMGGVVFGLIMVSIQVAVEAVERSRYLSVENELLKQEQLQARYEGLKHQLSPHFLFNSLSTLSGLIHDEPTAAGQFVEEMSLVYRYLLRHGELQAVPLREELAFLQSYVYLLQMRFGDGLQLRLDLPEAIQDRLLPPLALQLLVENTVKHNTLTRRQPLTISIEFRAPATLVVRNNRRPRLTPEPSSGLGLSNLTNRIRILHHKELLVEDTADEFTVYLPLPT